MHNINNHININNNYTQLWQRTSRITGRWHIMNSICPRWRNRIYFRIAFRKWQVRNAGMMRLSEAGCCSPMILLFFLNLCRRGMGRRWRCLCILDKFRNVMEDRELGIAKTTKTGSLSENWTTFCIKSMLWGVFDLWRPRHRRRNWLIDAFGSKMPNSCKFTNANLKSMSWDALGATPITILMPIRVNWWNHSGSRIPFPNSTLVWTSRRDAAVRWLRHFGSQTVFD